MKVLTFSVRFVGPAAIAAVLLLIAAGCGKAKSSGGTQAGSLAVTVSNKVEAIEAAGEPVTLGQLNKWYAEPAPGENAAELYAQAFAAVTADDPKSANFLARNQKALGLLLQAAERKSCRYSIDLREGLNTRLEHLAKIKRCASLLAAEIVSQAGRDRTDAATKAALAGVRLARSLENEPIIVSHLVEAASLALVLQGVEQALTRKAFADEQLASLQAALRDAETSASLRRGLVGERCSVVSLFLMSPAELAKALSMAGENAGSASVSAASQATMADYVKSPTFYRDFDFALNYFSNLLAIASIPAPQSLDAQFTPKTETAVPEEYQLSSMLLPALQNTVAKSAELTARLRVARAALAVERYRMQHSNTLPASLAELAPALIEAVPLDPFDSQPVRLGKGTGKGFVVYSVGKDRKDDGGAGKIAGSSSTADLAFTVQR